MGEIECVGATSLDVERGQACKESAFKCLMCGKDKGSIFLDACADLYLAKPYTVDYHKCAECALVQQHPLPADVSDFYDFYPIHQTKAKAYSWFRRRLMSGVYLPPTQWPAGTRLLDFGCGDGWYLEWCKEAGLDVVGFEYSASHAHSLTNRLGVEVLSDALVLAQRHAESFDVITLHFVVEHLTDPMGIFEMLRILLKPGGVIRYVVPNISSWEFRLFKRRWHSLDAPRHISFLNATHARYIANRTAINYLGERSVAFPNGFGGSIPTVFLGAFSASIFILALPLSIIVTKLFPGGNTAYVLKRPA